MTGWTDILDQWLQDPRILYGALLLAGFLLGWLASRIRTIRRIATLETMLEYEVESADQRIAAMGQSFSSLSSEALQHSNRQFLELASETLSRFTSQADHSLQLRQQAVEQMVAPLKESLARTETELNKFDQSRAEAHGNLTGQIESLSRQNQQIEQETRNLSLALRRPEVRGQWGEISLRRLVELAGMSAYCDFTEQSTSTDGSQRPDLLIHLPGNRQVVVDVKTPLDAYLSAVSASDDQQQQRFLSAHALQLKKRINELAAKSYWAAFAESAEFVVLFIPGDQFLSAALEKQPRLLEEALEKRIILATPTSLVALLRTIAYGWTQDKLNLHALEIRESAEEYHQRLANFSEHLEALGVSLDRAVNSYNQGIGSFQHKLMPIARRFSELGLRRDKQVRQPEPILTRPTK